MTMDLTRLTMRELDMHVHAVAAEVKRRIAIQLAQHREDARRARLEQVVTPLEVRTSKDPSRTRKVAANPEVPNGRGAGGIVLKVVDGERIVQCTTCPDTFASPLQRGRAPRCCPSCKENR